MSTEPEATPQRNAELLALRWAWNSYRNRADAEAAKSGYQRSDWCVLVSSDAMVDVYEHHRREIPISDEAMRELVLDLYAEFCQRVRDKVMARYHAEEREAETHLDALTRIDPGKLPPPTTPNFKDFPHAD